jgi:hypothetical protein
MPDSKAAYGGHWHIMNWLLKGNIQPSDSSMTEAVRGNQIEVIQLLIQNGICPRPENLIDALGYENFETFELFMRYGMEVKIIHLNLLALFGKINKRKIPIVSIIVPRRAKYDCSFWVCGHFKMVLFE